LNGLSAPAIKLDKSDFWNYLFHWVEFVSVAGLGTAGSLSGSIIGNFHLGTYATSEQIVYLNPGKIVNPTDTAWVASQITFGYNERDPSIRNPGSIGDIIYFSRAEGPFKAT